MSNGIDGSTSVLAVWMRVKSVNRSHHIICSIQAQRCVVVDGRPTCWPQWEAGWEKDKSDNEQGQVLFKTLQNRIWPRAAHLISQFFFFLLNFTLPLKSSNPYSQVYYHRCFFQGHGDQIIPIVLIAMAALFARKYTSEGCSQWGRWIIHSSWDTVSGEKCCCWIF